MSAKRSRWWATLEPERRETVAAILREQKRLMAKPHSQSPSSPVGLCVFISPTTGTPKVVEVRKRFRDGWTLFWRVERDGEVSAKGLRSPGSPLITTKEVESHGTA